ncbi:MobV family relaxase [Streptococcus dysgalactiae]|uniref:MobV family relaxase n=1 Tax=Streptococcus dysgalactiae TaxID=1334 RepID=UPI003D737810
MSYAVARMVKYKSGNLGGAYRHNERIFENHSNKDIDPERSHLNYELTDRDRSIPYDKQIKQYVNDNKLSKRAIRKDAVLCNEWIITSDKAFFEKMSQEQTKEFFETAKNFFAERYGEQNIAYAMVHLDESTPHMHLGLVPMKDGKLSSKALFGHKEQLKEIQEEFPKYLNDKGYTLQRGEVDSERKHLDTAEYKEKQRLLDDVEQQLSEKQDKLEQISQKINQLELTVSEKEQLLQHLEQKEWHTLEELKQYEKEIESLAESLTDLKEVEPLGFRELHAEGLAKRTLDGKLKMNRETYNRLYQTASKNATNNVRLRQDRNALEHKLNKSLKYQNNLAKSLIKSENLLTENRELKSEVDKLQHENKSLRQEMERLKDSLKAVSKKLALWRKNAKKYLPEKEYRSAMRLANQIRPPKINIVTTVKTVKNVIEKNLF